MAITSHFQGGISTGTVKVATKLSAAAYNIRTAFIKNTDKRASNACPGLDVGDVILSQPGYVRFSNNVSRATSGTVATARVKQANVLSVTGIVSNCMIFAAWAKY